MKTLMQSQMFPLQTIAKLLVVDPRGLVGVPSMDKGVEQAAKGDDLRNRESEASKGSNDADRNPPSG